MNFNLKALFYIWLLITTMILTGCKSNTDNIQSPDGNLNISFLLKNGKPYYAVCFKRDTILRNSELSLTIAEHVGLLENFKVTNTATRSVTNSWKPVAGSKSEYPDNYNELRVSLEEAQGEKRTLIFHFRAYNEGVAFRYEIPEQKAMKDYEISSENTEFQFTANHKVFFDDYPQADYEEHTIATMPANSIRPLLLKTDKYYVAIAEAGSLENYAPLKLDRLKENCLISNFRKGTVKVKGALTTPWRVIMVAEHAGTLVENHYLLQNLSPENAISNTSWIKPGKCWRSGLTTESAKAIIDYASKHNYQYVHYDAGWYGRQSDPKSNPITYLDEIDILQVTSYAESKGVGLICYINKIALADYDIDTTFSTYEKWGIKGVKFGFVNWESQEDLDFLYMAIRKAAQYHLIVDIHDNYRLTGSERTYPNLLTAEGILGNEAKTHNEPYNVLVTSFARMIAGAGDFTPCYLNNRVISRSWQLALGVVFYSPLQYLHWYDVPQKYESKDYPELEFWDRMPTTWDDTKVLNGEVGEYMTVARQSDDAWFIGTLTNQARTLNIPLSFLKSGNYIAKIFKENTSNKLLVDMETIEVTAQDKLEAIMSDGSGYAVWISKE